jgi:hypothetical protein
MPISFAYPGKLRGSAIFQAIGRQVFLMSREYAFLLDKVVDE